MIVKALHECWLCGCTDKPLAKFPDGNHFECGDCRDFDRDIDLEEFEEVRRLRIAEANEY